jgi:hypothetical protein
MNCERCQKNPARVRVDQMVEGRRESHYLCQQCVDELMQQMTSKQAGGSNNIFDAFSAATGHAPESSPEKAREAQQKCSLVHKDGQTFLLTIHPDYIDPQFIPQDATLGDNKPIDTTYRIKANLEKEGWVQTGDGLADTNPNCHYWNFSRTTDN